jgi:hypothetical protein
MTGTLLLCFIHGFKGDEETFFQFPQVCLYLYNALLFVGYVLGINTNLQELQTLIAEKEQNLDVRIAVYPKYETRGDLAVCVEIFREWYAVVTLLLAQFEADLSRLQSQVTDLERESGSPFPISDPSVKVILLAHSAG